MAALAMTWPIATQMGTHAIGTAYGDEFERVRLIWWTRDALQHAHNPFYQSLLAYPVGFFSAPQWSEPLAYVPAALIAFVTTPLLAYNLWTLIELIASGWAACFHNALKGVARQRKVNVTDSAVSLEVHLVGGMATGFDFEVTIEAQLPGIPAPAARELLEAAHQVCPYSRATRGNIPVTLVVVPDED